jgi:Bacterial protein of unknown function (DUF839)
MARPTVRILCGVTLTTTLLVTGAPAEAAPGAATGPSSSQSPYVLPSQPGVVTKSVLTVGDSVNLKPNGTPYRMVGIPDGLGAFDNGDGTFTVLMNHELGGTAGAVRAHGARGAFVSKWTVRKDDLSVVAGEDLIKQVALWDIDAAAYDDPATGIVISRLCSADLPLPSALLNSATGNGYDGSIFFDGEEVAGGRAFAHLMNGTSYELPWMGKASWENILANPGTGDKTVVAGLDDTTPGQVYLYAGDKKSTGSPVERAGLTGGNLYGIKVTGFPSEPGEGVPSGTPFTLHDFGDASAKSALEIEQEGADNGVTSFLRPEDGTWDPKRPSDLYFVTTATFGGNSRLWRLRFNDPGNPTQGGVIDMLLDGTEDGGTGERYHMFDNMTINGRRQLVLQEDPGNQSYLARIWLYDIASDTLTEVAHHDPARFDPPNPALTQDEESSGVIDVSTILGSGWYLLDVQAHYNPGDPELVEGGQLLAMHIPPGRR